MFRPERKKIRYCHFAGLYRCPILLLSQRSKFLQLLCRFFTDSKVSIRKGFTTIFRTIKRSRPEHSNYVCHSDQDQSYYTKRPQKVISAADVSIIDGGAWAEYEFSRIWYPTFISISYSLKFRYSEKASKFERISDFVLRLLITYFSNF